MNLLPYQFYELSYLALAPARALNEVVRLTFKNPLNPLNATPLARKIAAGAELFERATRRYGKPAFSLDQTIVAGEAVPIVEEIVWEKPFCRLLHFKRLFQQTAPRQSKLLIVAPMSGHYATLLRGTVEAFLPTHDVYITDWADARMTPLAFGRFDLDDYIDYLIEMFAFLSEKKDGVPAHALGVCQPAVPLVSAIALMEARGDVNVPRSMIIMGGPIDTRINPTEVNKVAEKRGLNWFRRHSVHIAPFPYLGAGRRVYPGFMQLSGFMAMNIDRHVNAQLEMFNHLVAGDGDSAEKHREFYDEYLAVMDLTAEFYLQTLDEVFIRHSLPKGQFFHRGECIDLSAIRNVGLMTVEGGKDDITGAGQTEAAQALCVAIPKDRRNHYVQPDVGHYGVFNGARFRRDIVPRIGAFCAQEEAH